MDKTSAQHSQTKKLVWETPEITVIASEQTEGKTSPGGEIGVTFGS